MTNPPIKKLPKSELNKLQKKPTKARYGWARLTQTGMYIEALDDMGTVGDNKASRRQMSMYESARSWCKRNNVDWDFSVHVSPDNKAVIRAVRIK